MKLRESGIILFCEKYDEALRFYTEVLGLATREKHEDLAVLDFGGSYLMIEGQGIASPEPKTRAQNPTVLRLNVDDFDDAVSEIRSRGAHVEVHEFGWGTIGVIVDPEGNRIEIKN